jgi:hypothetical protein
MSPDHAKLCSQEMPENAEANGVCQALHCQAISQSPTIDFRALMSTQSHSTFFVREPSGPFCTIDCRGPVWLRGFLRASSSGG